MTEQTQKELGKTLWNIADTLRGAMGADDFRDYMLSFLFLRYLSDNYEQAARKELGGDYPDPNAVGNGGRTPLSVWYEANPVDVAEFEKQMRRKVHYVASLHCHRRTFLRREGSGHASKAAAGEACEPPPEASVALEAQTDDARADS